MTTEYEFSQLSPHMLYFAHNYEMGDEDAYDRVFDGDHRDVFKQAFNKMIKSSSQLNLKPDMYVRIIFLKISHISCTFSRTSLAAVGRYLSKYKEGTFQFDRRLGLFLCLAGSHSERTLPTIFLLLIMEDDS